MNAFIKNFHLIPIPPIFPIAISFIFGILLHNSIMVLVFFFFISLCYLIYAHKNKITISSRFIVCLLFVAIGAYLHHKDLTAYHNFYLFTDNKKVTIIGTVIDKNEMIIQSKKSTFITLAIDTIRKDNCLHKSNKFIILHCNNTENISVADAITVNDVICKKPSSESFQQYQIKEQIVAIIFDQSLHYTIDHHPTWSMRRWLWEHKTRIFTAAQNKLSPNTFRFFSALFLGNRFCIKNSLEKTNDQFKSWGISHFLARSGLHLALFVLIWQTIFCFIPLPITIKQYVILILSFMYFILTWTSAPFTRSFALFILNKICFFTKTSFHLLHYLTIICFSFLLYCPLYLFFLDFQLTFALTFALAWLNQLSMQYHSNN